MQVSCSPTDGPKVLEFNCRFGDPETQVILPLLETDLLAVMDACVDGRMAGLDLRWSDSAAATVVAASGGYPGDYETGKPITGIDSAEAEGCTVFHAGTALANSELRTAGGRVLAVTGSGPRPVAGHRTRLRRHAPHSLRRNPLSDRHRPHRHPRRLGPE